MKSALEKSTELKDLKERNQIGEIKEDSVSKEPKSDLVRSESVRTEMAVKSKDVDSDMHCQACYDKYELSLEIKKGS